MVNNILDSTKKGYYKAKLISSIGNDKKMWEVIIGLLKTKKVNKTLIDDFTMNGEVVSDPTVICHEIIYLLLFFFIYRTGIRLKSNSIKNITYALFGNYASMTLTPTTSDEITNVIKQQKYFQVITTCMLKY